MTPRVDAAIGEGESNLSGGGAMSDESRTSSGTATSPRQRLFVMRHGERQDEIDESWASTSDRPWDPPLSSKGREQARKAGEALRYHNITRVVSSPFVRCIETATEAASELGVPFSKWVVDCQLGEVMDRRCLRFSEDSGSEEVEQWLAEGKGVSTTLPAGEKDDVEMSGRPASYPESLEDAHRRYSQALDAVADRFPGENILVVTHGEAVSRSVTRVLPETIVYETKHCGYTVACREGGDADGVGSGSEGEENWHLETLPGETGVLWCE